MYCLFSLVVYFKISTLLFYLIFFNKFSQSEADVTLENDIERAIDSTNGHDSELLVVLISPLKRKHRRTKFHL